MICSSSAIKLSPNALTVLEKRYPKKNKDGQVVEMPEETFWRVERDGYRVCDADVGEVMENLSSRRSE